MAEALCCGLMFEGARLFQCTREDNEMRRRTPPRPLNGLTYVHEVMACLIQGVYACDKGEENPGKYWQNVQYEPVNPIDFHFGDKEDRREVADPNAPYARLMLYRRVNQGPNGGFGRMLRLENETEGARIQWPLYVVAIRGTIPSRSADVFDDLRIVFETICRTVELHRPVVRLLTAIHRQYGRDMWVTGHSLGGILGLIATRRLAARTEDPIILDAHFFNTANFSLDVLAKKLFLGSMNGLADGARKIWVVGRPAAMLIRGGGSLVVRTAEWTARGTLETLFPRKYEAARGAFEALRVRQFVPHLYVNPKDAICNEYIRHFQGDRSPPVSNAVPISQLLVDSVSCHLIPQAHLHTNHWASGPHEAHKLHQWYLYPLVNIRSELVG